MKTDKVTKKLDVEMASLIENRLRKASLAYYDGGVSELSDQEFDQLKDQLENLDSNNLFLSEVGVAPSDSALQKVTHSIPMGSLKKINTPAEFKTWCNTVSKTTSNLECSVQMKFDGISVEIIYENGKFIQAITRGNGEIGDDVTHTLRNAQNFPRKISNKSRVSVRCEVMLNIADWQEHFSDKANPRNAAAGLVRRTDAKGSKHLSTYAFDVLFDNSNFETEADKIKWLSDEGFQTTMNQVVKENNVEDCINAIINSRSEIKFEIDGAVVKLNSISDQEKLGEHQGRPYWARAWKFAAMGAHTTLLGVNWSVGTQGTITPVAKVAPVKVGGTTIQNVTLHNMDEIERLGIYIGDEIEVIRAGDVIPYIVRVVTEGKNRTKITINACPSCSSSVERVGPKLICLNGNCEGVQFKKIQKWIKKRDIMFLGDSNLQTLWDNKVVLSIPDLYELTIHSIVQAGLGERMSEKILEQITKSRKCSLSDLIGSLSLDMLGRSEASNLVKQGIDTVGKWKNLKVSDIEELEGFQKTKALRISKSVAKNWLLIKELFQYMSPVTKEPNVMLSTGNKFASKSFCFTGKMENPRKNLEAITIDNGGTVKSVNKDLNFLVIADLNSKSSKAVKARKLGIKLISEADFLEMA